MLYLIVLLTVALCVFASKLLTDLTDEISNQFQADMAYSVRANTYSTESIFVYGFLCGLKPPKIFNPIHAVRRLQQNYDKVLTKILKIMVMPWAVKETLKAFFSSFSATYKAFNLERFSIKDMLIRRMWNASGKLFGDRADRHVFVSWLLNQRRLLAVAASIVVALITTTQVDPVASTITGAVLGVTAVSNSNKEIIMQKDMMKTWITVEKEEYSIQTNWRTLLVLDFKREELTVIDLETGVPRDIEWHSQYPRITKFKDIVDEAKKLADITPVEVKPTKPVSLEEVLEAIKDRQGKNLKEKKESAVDVLGSLLIESLGGDASKWPTENGLVVDGLTYESSFYKYLNESRGKLLAIAKSLVEWNTHQIEVDVYAVDNMKETFTAKSIQRLTRNKVFLLKYGMGYRRDCPFEEYDAKFIKIVDFNSLKKALKLKNNFTIAEARKEMEDNGEEFTAEIEEDITKSMKELIMEDDWNGDGFGYRINKEDTLLKNIMEGLFPDYLRQGYSFFGGNPTSGILIFLKNDRTTRPKLPKDVGNGQKLVKYMLRSGLHTTASKGETVDVILKRFDAKRDGLDLLLLPKFYYPIGDRNGMKLGVVSQITYSEKFVTIFKGLFGTPTNDNPETWELIGSNDGVMNLDTYNAVFGLNHKEGDTVTLKLDCFWIMGTANSCQPVEMRVSNQAVTRSPIPISNYLNSINLEEADRRNKAGASDDARDLLGDMPRYGEIIPLIDYNLHVPLDIVWNKDKYGNIVKNDAIKGYKIKEVFMRTITQDIVKSADKGCLIRKPKSPEDRRAYRLYSVHDSSLSVKTGKYDHPGISMPKASGLKVGDYTIIVTYPALPAGIYSGKTISIFVAKVEKLTNGKYLGMNPISLANALGDEDGDMYHILIPSKKDWENNPDMITCGMAFIKVSAIDKAADNKKATVFKKRLTDDLMENSLLSYELYIRLLADIGIRDNMMTTCLLYLNGKEVKTPTGQRVVDYLSSFVQAAIQDQKHPTLPEYNMESFIEWSQEHVKEAWKPDQHGELRFVNHPEIACRKVKKLADGSPVTLDMLADHIVKYDAQGIPSTKWVDFIRKNISFKLTKEGFVTPEFYQDIAGSLFMLFADPETGIIRNPYTINELALLVDDIKEEYLNIIRGSNSHKRYDKAREMLMATKFKLRHQFTKAERIMLQIILVNATTTDVWTHICEEEFMHMISYFSDNMTAGQELFKMLEVDGRHVIRGERKYKKQKEDMTGKHVRTRLWISKKIYGALPLVKEKDILVIEKYQTKVDGIVVNLDSRINCYDGVYLVTKIEDYKDKKGFISPTNLYVHLEKRV